MVLVEVVLEELEDFFSTLTELVSCKKISDKLTKFLASSLKILAA